MNTVDLEQQIASLSINVVTGAAILLVLLVIATVLLRKTVSEVSALMRAYQINTGYRNRSSERSCSKTKTVFIWYARSNADTPDTVFRRQYYLP